MAFVFRFERVLGYREELERRALIKTSEMQRQRDRELVVLNGFKDDARKIRSQWAELEGSDMPMDEILRIRRRWTALHRNIEQQDQVVRDWEKKLDKARAEWVEARKAKKVLEKLKERDLAEFGRTVQKAENQLLDEVSVRPYTTASAAGRTRGDNGN